MPELPDLLYIRKYLIREITSRTITDVKVRQPVVIRVALDQPFDTIVIGREIEGVEVHGPFLRIALTGKTDLVINFMLGGKLQHERAGEKPAGYMCCSLLLDDGSRLNICDDQKMAKVYAVRRGHYAVIPSFDQQGVDILSPEFTLELFRRLAARHSRKQVRVFVHDHSILSAIGNAYADEILFDARIHPKTFIHRLSPQEIEALYSSIRSVIAWGIRTVEAQNRPIHVKVRDHVKVRGRKGQPCPRCGTTIRREGVRGHDVFFCPDCQPATRRLFVDWKRIKQPGQRLHTS
jgi:formamidopyrimidine-DNA glycosylase